jgi:hypothetical protein
VHCSWSGRDREATHARRWLPAPGRDTCSGHTASAVRSLAFRTKFDFSRGELGLVGFYPPPPPPRSRVTALGPTRGEFEFETEAGLSEGGSHVFSKQED